MSCQNGRNKEVCLNAIDLGRNVLLNLYSVYYMYSKNLF